MEFKNELLEDVSISLANEQRTLARIMEKRETYPETSQILDPLIKRIQEMCAHLEKLKIELRLAAVASRT